MIDENQSKWKFFFFQEFCKTKLKENLFAYMVGRCSNFNLLRWMANKSLSICSVHSLYTIQHASQYRIRLIYQTVSMVLRKSSVCAHRNGNKIDVQYDDMNTKVLRMSKVCRKASSLHIKWNFMKRFLCEESYYILMYQVTVVFITKTCKFKWVLLFRAVLFIMMQNILQVFLTSAAELI